MVIVARPDLVMMPKVKKEVSIDSGGRETFANLVASHKQHQKSGGTAPTAPSDKAAPFVVHPWN